MARKTWVVCLALSLVACSFGMQGPPPGHQQMTQFACSESIARPIADIVGGLFLGGILSIAAGLSSWGNGGENSTTTGLLAAATVGTVVLFGSSATTGLNKVSQCHSAKRELAARRAVGDTLAQTAETQSVAPRAAATPAGAPPIALPPAAGSPAAAAIARGQAATADALLRRAPTIEISGSRDTLVVGAKLQLLASARSASGAQLANLVYRWTSSNDATATVGLAGRVTAAAPGLVTITAHFGTVTTSVNIVIVPR